MLHFCKQILSPAKSTPPTMNTAARLFISSGSIDLIESTSTIKENEPLIRRARVQYLQTFNAGSQIPNVTL